MDFPSTNTICFIHQDDEDFCNKVADILMVEADGGDSPAAVVKWAIQKARAEIKVENAEKKATEARDRANRK